VSHFAIFADDLKAPSPSLLLCGGDKRTQAKDIERGIEPFPD
jgi:putative component of toxin-antitoxin plasmid stabilization module